MVRKIKCAQSVNTQTQNCVGGCEEVFLDVQCFVSYWAPGEDFFAFIATFQLC